MFAPERGCLAVMWPLATHPSNKNEVLAWDLTYDPSELPLLDIDTLRLRLFTKQADLPEGMQRLPIKSVHVNKSPMVVKKLKTLTDEMAAKWGIDIPAALANAEKARALPDMSAIWPELFNRPKATNDMRPDVDEDLYGGFVGNADRRRLNQLRELSPDELAVSRMGFDDDRLAELVFRYRARNFVQTLKPDELERWEAHRAARLLDGEGGARNIDALLAQLDTLQEAADEKGLAVLEALSDYAEQIAPELE
jgi:exodeoxyribonuclease-1